MSESTASAVIDASSFSPDNNSRDGMVRSASLLDVQRYPVITFTAEQPRESEGGWVLPGTLSVREVASPIRLDVQQLSADAEGLRTRASVRIDRTEFGVTASRGMTGRYLDMVLDIVAARSA